MARVSTFRRRQQDIVAFADALGQLLAVLNPDGGSWGSYPTWRCPPGHEQEAARLAARVDVLSGKAAPALEAVGAHIAWKPRGAFAWQTQPVNPAASWRTIIEGDPMFPPDMIFAVCNQAIGALDAAATDAEEREASLRGKLARGMGSVARAASKGRAVITAALVAVAAPLLVAYLVFRFGWVGG